MSENRKSYAESCAVLQSEGLLEGDAVPELPKRAPRYDDEETAVSFFRTSVADVVLAMGLRNPLRGSGFCMVKPKVAPADQPLGFVAESRWDSYDRVTSIHCS